tara:strand:- start:827 stop:1552 length:726 start_codon:yes stop_codon:yes gene_type:complete
MNKNFLKKDNIIVASKKIFYLKLLIVFVVSIISSIAIYVYINSFVIMNLNDSYEANIKLKDKINSLKIEINRNQEYIKKLEQSNKEINSIFNKYTDAIKYELATAEEVKSELFKKEEKILELNREINYYKFLSSSKNTNDLISIENFNAKFSKNNNYLEYSFLLLSNRSNLNIKGTYNLYFFKDKNTTNKINFKILDNKIKFKNFIKVSGKVKVNKNVNFDDIYLDVKYNKKIYNYKYIIK